MRKLVTRVLPIVLFSMASPLLGDPVLYSYRGVLEQGGSAVTATLDLRLRFFDAPDPGSSKEVSAPVRAPDTEVVDGRFRIDLEMDTEALGLRELWAQIEVAWPTSSSFTILQPRQRLELQSATASPAPAGSIVFFDLVACPSGWSEYTPARGRVIVGLPPGGTLGGTVGESLTNLSNPAHTHTWSPFQPTVSTTGNHTHPWAVVNKSGGDTRWLSWDYYGAPTLLYSWGNGVGNEGSGVYPLAATPTQTLYTSSGGEHGHAMSSTSIGYAGGSLPYVQLLACRKD